MSAREESLAAADGLTQWHELILQAVPDGARVLDVGCGTGHVAAALRARGCRVTGIEIDPHAAAQARQRCDALVAGDVEDPFDRTHLPGDRDAVIFGDVLGYLRDPAGTLAAVRELLAPGGRVLVAVPNAGVWRARREALRGRFPSESGVNGDHGRLHHFTRESARALAREAGFFVEREGATAAALPFERHGPDRVDGLRGRFARLRPELFAHELVLVLRPRPGA